MKTRLHGYKKAMTIKRVATFDINHFGANLSGDSNLL